MSKYRNQLPQLSGNGVFLTDGGMETTMIFHEGIDLPYFAVFNMMQTDSGVAKVRDYYRRYAEMARRSNVGFVLESPTWRANPDWAAKLGYSRDDLADINRRSIDLMAELRRELETSDIADGDFRCDRPARRRLSAGSYDELRGGRRLSQRADPRVRRQRGRHGERVHAQLCGGSGRHR